MEIQKFTMMPAHITINTIFVALSQLIDINHAEISLKYM